jgi:thiol-activated cytolysin
MMRRTNRPHTFVSHTSLLFCSVWLVSSCLADPATYYDAESGTSSSDADEIDADETDLDVDDASAIDEYLSGLDSIDQEEESAIERITTGYEQDGSFLGQVDNYKGVVGFNEFMWLDSGTDVLYPGSLLDGDAIQYGVYAPVGLERGSLTITLNLQSLQGGITADIAEAKYSTVESAIHELLSNEIDGDAGAEMSWDVFEVYSSTHLRQSIGVNVDVAGIATIEAAFDWNSTENSQKVVARFTQKYYDVVVDAPINPSDFLAETVTEDLVKASVYGVSPVYISSVGYGRYALFCFETADTTIDLKATVEGLVSLSSIGIPVDISVDAETEYEYMLENTNTQAFVLGGSGTDASGAVTSYEQFRSYIENGGTYSKDSPGKPISYAMRYLSDNTPAKVVMSTEYETVTCSPAYTSYRITLKSLGVVNIEGSDGSLELSGDIKVYGGGEVASEGGATLWSRSGTLGDYLSIPDGGEKEINESTIISFPDLAYEDRSTAYIEIEHHLKDTAPADIGACFPAHINQPGSTVIYLDRIAEGEHTIVTAGEHYDHRVSLTYSVEGME